MHVFSRRPYRAFLSIFALTALFVFSPAPAKADMKVLDIVLTTGVVDREPIDTVTSFEANGEKAYVYARLRNTDGPGKLNFVWYLDNVERARVQMLIGTSVRWRTWSSSMVGPGNWRVDLVDQYGKILAQREFVVGIVAPKTPGTLPKADK